MPTDPPDPSVVWRGLDREHLLAPVAKPIELNAEDVRDLIEEARYRSGRLAKVPLAFYEALIGAIRANDAERPRSVRDFRAIFDTAALGEEPHGQ